MELGVYEILLNPDPERNAMKPEMPNAACIGKAELFFINLPYTTEERTKERHAKQLCLICPHIVQCRDYAIAHEEYGIWGGTSEKERQILRREMNITVFRPEKVIIEQERIKSRRATFAAKSMKVTQND